MAKRPPLYKSRRAWRVRVVQGVIWLGVASATGFLITGWRENESDRAALIVLALALFVAAALFEVYLRRYVIHIARVGKTIELTTLTSFRSRTISAPRTVLDQRSAEYVDDTHGRYSSWRLIKIDGRMLPFILDTTDGDEMD